MANPLINYLTGVFLSLTGQAQEPKDYIYNHERSSAFFLSHEGDCADLGIMATESEGAVYMIAANLEESGVDVHLKTFQDYRRRDGFGFQWTQDGCIQKNQQMSEIFFTHSGDLFRGFSEEKYGVELVDDIVKSIEDYKTTRLPKLVVGGMF